MAEELTSYQTACFIAGTLDDKLGKDIVILNISKVSMLADYFVICTGDSTPQVKALTEYVRDKMKKTFSRYSIGEEKDMKNHWNLLDYGDVVVHILHKEERETYAIEKFWSHAMKIDKSVWEKDAKQFSEYKKD